MNPSQERHIKHLTSAAELIMALCEEAGVSKAPSEVRYQLARKLDAACSQATVRRLLEALKS